MLAIGGREGVVDGREGVVVCLRVVGTAELLMLPECLSC